MRKLLNVIVIFCFANTGAQGQDGGATLQKMFAAYAALGSYSHTINATVTTRLQNNSQSGGLTATLRYRKPDRAYVSVTTPQNGTIYSYCDGRQQIIYRARQNLYEKLPAPTSLAGFVKNLASVRIFSEMDAMDFLQAPPPKSKFSNIVAKGAQTVNGVPCFVVEANFKSTVIVPGKIGKATFYVDQKSYLLRKMLTEIKGIPRVAIIRGMQKGKPVTAQVKVSQDVSSYEIVQEMSANPALNDSAFTYPLPKDAVEQNIGKYTGK